MEASTCWYVVTCPSRWWLPRKEGQELHVSEALAGHVAAALEKVAMVSELMPALRSLQLGDGNGPELAESIERFITFRHLSGQPVTVVNFNLKDQVGSLEE